MLLTRSGWLKALATLVAAGAFFATYEVTIQDSKKKDPLAPPEPGERFTISATAYCKGSVTFAGIAAQNGVAASDKSLFPMGSIVQIQTGDARYDGMYTILDTGPEIKGHEIDIYMWSCYDALDFGRRDIKVTLLRRGWDPHAIAPARPTLVDRLLGRQPKGPPVLEAGRPVPSRSATPPRQAPPQSASPVQSDPASGDVTGAGPESADPATPPPPPPPTEPPAPAPAVPPPQTP